MDLLFSMTILVAREFASTHSVTSCSFTHQPSWDGSIWDALVMISASIRCKRRPCTLLSHLVVTAFALHLTNVVATWSQPHTGKCPVNFPNKEKMLHQVSMLAAVGSSPSYCHCSLLCSSQMCKPNTWMLFLSNLRSLLGNPNHSSCIFM